VINTVEEGPRISLQENAEHIKIIEATAMVEPTVNEVIGGDTFKKELFWGGQGKGRHPCRPKGAEKQDVFLRLK
jgi:hypothetical protein